MKPFAEMNALLARRKGPVAARDQILAKTASRSAAGIAVRAAYTHWSAESDGDLTTTGRVLAVSVESAAVAVSNCWSGNRQSA